jgi:hypothetical protein
MLRTGTWCRKAFVETDGEEERESVVFGFDRR